MTRFQLTKKVKPLPLAYSTLDKIAAIDHELIEVLQETLYFFAVLFLVDLKLFQSHILEYGLALVIMSLSAIRFAYFLSPRFLLSAVANLTPEQKAELLQLYDAHDKDGISSLLHEQLGMRSASRVADRLCRVPRPKFYEITRTR